MYLLNTEEASTSAYLDNVVHHIKDILSSPESGLLLRELYYDEYTKPLSTNEELVFGDALFRPEEDVTEYNTYRTHLRDYINYDINKFFNLNVSQYVETTTFMKIIMIEEAIHKMKELNKERSDVEQANSSLLKELEGNEYE